MESPAATRSQEVCHWIWAAAPVHRTPSLEAKAGGLLSVALSLVLSSVVFAAEGVLLRCPDVNGICEYTPPDSWRVVWHVRGWGLRFWRPGEGLIVARLSVHVGPHYLVVLDEEGRELLVRDLTNDGGLKRVSGDGPGGSVVLCQGIPRWGHQCETVVGARLQTALRFLSRPAGVAGCTFPRTMKGGWTVCVASGRPSRLVRFRRGKQRKEEIELPSSLGFVGDVLPYGGQVYVLGGSGKRELWVTDFGKMEQVRAPEVSAIWRSSVGVIVELRAYDPVSRAHRCAVGIVANASVRSLWEGDCIGVESVVEIEPGVLLADTWSADLRRIIRLDIRGQSLRAEEVWRNRIR